VFFGKDGAGNHGGSPVLFWFNLLPIPPAWRILLLIARLA
jgi:hypothetical protein